jgi:hypothetical protein
MKSGVASILTSNCLLDVMEHFYRSKPARQALVLYHHHHVLMYLNLSQDSNQPLTPVLTVTPNTGGSFVWSIVPRISTCTWWRELIWSTRPLTMLPIDGNRCTWPEKYSEIQGTKDSTQSLFSLWLFEQSCLVAEQLFSLCSIVMAWQNSGAWWQELWFAWRKLGALLGPLLLVWIKLLWTSASTNPSLICL